MTGDFSGATSILFQRHSPSSTNKDEEEDAIDGDRSANSMYLLREAANFVGVGG